MADQAREEATSDEELAPAAEDADAEGAPADGVSPSAAIEAEVAEFRELAQRVQADFENYRKRVLREQTELVERATQGLIEQLLPVLDSCELALSSLEGAEEKVRKGVELVFAELFGVLEKAGLERIDALGKPFDPTEHEAVAQEDGDGEPVVCDILRSGYRLQGRVLRPATVRVTRAGA